MDTPSIAYERLARADDCAGGRAGPLGSYGVHHLFASVSTGVAGNYPAFTQGLTFWQSVNLVDELDRERLFLVHSSAREVQRFSAVGGAGVQPVSRDAIQGSVAQLPAGASRTTGTSQLQIRVDMTDHSQNRSLRFDAGQSLEVYAEHVSAAVLGPANMVDLLEAVPSTPVAPFNLTGVVVDALIGVTLEPVGQSHGKSSVTLTEHLTVAANTQGTIEVPPFARAVTIIQSVAGAASVAWDYFAGDPAVLATALALGRIPWIAGARKTEPLELLPNASHLQTDLDAVRPRFYTLIWTIKP